MSKKMEWYKAKLLPAADSIFSTSFYNNTSREVYCAVNSITPAHNRILVVSKMEENSVRIMTPHLAAFCIEVQDIASELDSERLNDITSGMLPKIGSTTNG